MSLMCIILTLHWKLRQEDCCDFEINISYIKRAARDLERGLVSKQTGPTLPGLSQPLFPLWPSGVTDSHPRSHQLV